MNNEERTRCEVFSRIVGYYRPTQQWNKSKQSEFKDRKTYETDTKEDKQED